jgi:glycosyltransferase involved in cell wall biosynthesis
MKVVITIPAYNEEKTLPPVLADIKRVMAGTKYKYQILVVNDGSRDKTAAIAKKGGALVVSNPRNLGLAKTFQREMAECVKLGADIIVHTDADGQYPSEHIPQLIAKVEAGYDLVLGSRFIKNNYKGEFLKNLGNRVFTRALRGLVGHKITDATTGFRGFTREVARDITYINTFTYTHEQIIRAAKQKFKIGEISIKTKPTPRASRLFKSPLQYAIKAWINIFRVYRDFDPLKFFTYCSMIFFIPACSFALWILVTLHNTGSVGGIPRVILCGLLFTTGIQMLLFGFLADMLRK